MKLYFFILKRLQNFCYILSILNINYGIIIFPYLKKYGTYSYLGEIHSYKALISLKTNVTKNYLKKIKKKIHARKF